MNTYNLGYILEMLLPVIGICLPAKKRKYGLAKAVAIIAAGVFIGISLTSFLIILGYEDETLSTIEAGSIAFGYIFAWFFLIWVSVIAAIFNWIEVTKQEAVYLFAISYAIEHIFYCIRVIVEYLSAGRIAEHEIVQYILTIEKPFNIDADTASGLIYGGTSAMFPSAMTLAQTWNQDLALEYGTMIGNEALLGGADGWYAPSMNIHRTPFSGRNGEYYSEDAFLSGAVASNEVMGAASKGMYTYIKHFAFNDQENHRGDRDGQYSIATWLNEQAAREIYLLPFEMCMKAGDVELNYIEKQADGSLANASKTIRATQAVMTSFNRVGATWAGGAYGLITGILRNEWAFDGLVMTDNANTAVFMDGYQMTEAGADVKLTSIPADARYDFDENDPATYYYARQAMHHMLYIVANSKSMNGLAPGGTVKDGTRLTTTVMRAVTIICLLLIALEIYKIFRLFKPTAKKLKKLQAKAERKAAKAAK